MPYGTRKLGSTSLSGFFIHACSEHWYDIRKVRTQACEDKAKYSDDFI